MWSTDQQVDARRPHGGTLYDHAAIPTVLLLSPTLRQSTELFRKTLALVETVEDKPGYLQKTATQLTLANQSKVVSLPGANPDAIRGFSKPALIIEDEAAFVGDRTFTSTRPMLAASDHPVHVLMSTPYGRRGHFHERWQANDPGWSKHTIKSDDCPRISKGFLEGERRVLSARGYRQEYECGFLEAATVVFPSDLVERLVDAERRRDMMPDRQEEGVRERQERLQAATMPDETIDLAKEIGLLDSGGRMTLDQLIDGPGPWATLDGDMPPASRIDVEDRAGDASALLREFCQLNNERSNLLRQDSPAANRVERIAEIDRLIAELRSHPGFPVELIKQEA